MWKNTVESGRSQMTVWCRMTKAADTHPEYVILIASPHNSGYANGVNVHCLSCHSVCTVVY